MKLFTALVWATIVGSLTLTSGLTLAPTAGLLQSSSSPCGGAHQLLPSKIFDLLSLLSAKKQQLCTLPSSVITDVLTKLSCNPPLLKVLPKNVLRDFVISVGQKDLSLLTALPTAVLNPIVQTVKPGPLSIPHLKPSLLDFSTFATPSLSGPPCGVPDRPSLPSLPALPPIVDKLPCVPPKPSLPLLFTLPPLPKFPSPSLPCKPVKPVIPCPPATPTPPIAVDPCATPSGPPVPLPPPTPAVPEIPAQPPVPTLPTLPAMPTLPTLPTLPAVPTLPTLPAVPTLPTLPAVPTLPTLPALPGVPPTPALPGVPPTPAVPETPTPAVPETPTPAVPETPTPAVPDSPTSSPATPELPPPTPAVTDVSPTRPSAELPPTVPTSETTANPSTYNTPSYNKPLSIIKKIISKPLELFSQKKQILCDKKNGSDKFALSKNLTSNNVIKKKPIINVSPHEQNSKVYILLPLPIVKKLPSPPTTDWIPSNHDLIKNKINEDKQKIMKPISFILDKITDLKNLKKKPIDCQVPCP